MLKSSAFIPAWWLRNSHLQTMWGCVLRAPVIIETSRERLSLPDEDFLDLDWLPNHDENDTQKPIVLILHGLSGNIESHYARAILLAIQQQGWHGVFMHYRGCSGEPNRSSICYHSGFTSDVEYVIATIRKRFPQNPIAAIGYSLGGSVLLNWLAKTQEANPLTAAIAISVPFELNKAANRMLQGFSRFYQWQILKCLRHDIVNKFQDRESPINLQHLDELTTFWEFDTFVTAPLHGFKNAEDYYIKTSCRKNLPYIKTPTLIIHSEDDPFMPPEVIPKQKELSNTTTLELSPFGGHVGFVSGNIPGVPYYWLEHRVIEHLQTHFPSYSNTVLDKESNIIFAPNS